MMESITTEKRKVLDCMARIEVELEPDEPCIVSFHYMYKDYLNDENLIDVRLNLNSNFIAGKSPKRRRDREKKVSKNASELNRKKG